MFLRGQFWAFYFVKRDCKMIEISNTVKTLQSTFSLTYNLHISIRRENLDIVCIRKKYDPAFPSPLSGHYVTVQCLDDWSCNVTKNVIEIMWDTCIISEYLAIILRKLELLWVTLGHFESNGSVSKSHFGLQNSLAYTLYMSP